MTQKISTALYTLTVFMAIASLPNKITAMQGSQERYDPEMKDPHHDKVCTHFLEGCGFTANHFSKEGGGELLKIFDINKSAQAHAERVHQANLARLRSPKRSLLSAAWGFVPSLSWPSFLTFSKKTPSPVSSEQSELSPTPIVLDQGDKLPSSSKGPEEFTMARAQDVPGMYFGLAQDGGGVRGLMEAILIQYLEKQTNQPIHKLFDYVGGSSIGGINSLGLTISKDGQSQPMSGSDLVDLFELHSNEIFPRHSKWNFPAILWDKVTSLLYARYPASNLERLLQGKIGNSMLSHALTNVMVTAVDSGKNEPIILGNRTHQTCLAWQAARSSSAAPTYFPAFQATSVEGKPMLIDGGIWQNNVSFELAMRIKNLAESTGDHFDFNQITMLSLGTGQMDFSPLPTDGGVLTAAGPLIDTFMQSQSAGVHKTMQSLLVEGKTYFRIDPKLPTVISLDSLDETSTRILKEAAENQFDAIDQFIASNTFRKRLDGIE